MTVQTITPDALARKLNTGEPAGAIYGGSMGLLFALAIPGNCREDGILPLR